MHVDIIAEDRNENPVLAVEVRVTVCSREELAAFIDRFLHMNPPLPFGMLVDLESIVVLKRDAQDPTNPVATFEALEVLSFYDPDFAGKDSRYGTRRIFGEYLGTLVEAWLRDVAYHWKSESPPGTEVLAHVGLLNAIEGGTTRTDATIAVTPLH
jgi:hypothetical protein